jgi:hypothetical protein
MGADFAFDAFAGPRAFAVWAARHLGAPDRLSDLVDLRDDGIAEEGIVFRRGCWQITIIRMAPHAVVPPHRHLRCASADLWLAGTATIDVPPLARGYALPPPAGRQHRTMRIPRGSVHSGVFGPDGATFVSFQQWLGEPGFVGDDWASA